MVWMAWRTLRWHPGSVLGAFVTLVVATTMVGGLWFVIDSVDRQEVPVERYAGVPLVIGTGGITGAIAPGLVAAVDALPEVATTVPELHFPAELSVRGVPVEVAGDQNPRPWGHGWSSARLTPFGILEGRPPRAAGEVVLDARLAEAAGAGIGDDVEIGVSGTVRPHEVVGVAATSTPWRYQSALFFADGHAAELAGHRSGTDALGVYPRPGTGVVALRAAVEQVLGAYNPPGGRTVAAVTGTERGLREGNLRAPVGGEFNTLWFMLGTAALVATGMVAAAVGLSVRRRGMELAVLRAMGARSRQIRSLLLAEGLLLAVVATAVAIPLGMLAAPVIADRFRDFRTVSAAFEVSYRPQAMAWTFALTLGVALAASLFAVARALRIRPGDALGEAPAEGRRLGKGRLLTGLALLVAAGGLSAVQLWRPGVFGGQIGTMLAQTLTLALVVASTGLVAPWFVRASGTLLRGGATRVARVSGFLAAANVVFNHRRFAGAASALTLGLTLVGATAGTQLFYDWSVAARSAGEISADHVVKAPPIGLSGELLRRVQSQEGTSAVVAVRSLRSSWRDARVPGRPPRWSPEICRRSWTCPYAAGCSAT
ncbi:ABC transporter permease [Nonomuraea sp. K274]|uniref:ABC transporter permease n=1 Tax=Nonomuraea cypriaca TaxID=1187855 RepID=A0A931ANA7_9ACTN|nr:ABC transporter permease [Nonomuraea cypriaca]MBF8192032.1 ABC transporter permease [Nonomuraea cypriaca]